MECWRDDYHRLGLDITRKQRDVLATQLAVLKSALANFAADHGREIEHNQEFRTKFTQLCQLVGVDPLELQMLAAQALAQAGGAAAAAAAAAIDTAVAVRVVEECHRTRDVNGGLITVRELVSRLKHEDELSALSNNLHLTEDNVLRALKVLAALGGGYELLTINGKQWLKFTNNVSSDHKRVYELCEFTGGFVTMRLLRDNYQWSAVRCQAVVDEMIMNGFLWVDMGAPGEGSEPEPHYWEPSWIA